MCLLLPAWFSRAFWLYIYETQILLSSSKPSWKTHNQLKFLLRNPSYSWVNSMLGGVFFFFSSPFYCLPSGYHLQFLLCCLLLHTPQTPASPCTLKPFNLFRQFILCAKQKGLIMFYGKLRNAYYAQELVTSFIAFDLVHLFSWCKWGNKLCVWSSVCRCTEAILQILIVGMWFQQHIATIDWMSIRLLRKVLS